MAYKKVRLGNYLLGYDEINKDGEFSDIDDLQGINSEKYFQGCKSNKNDIELNRYRICRHGMFAYNKATSRNGEKISIAYRTEGDCLISPSYICFSIKDENVLMPEYLMLWFKRPEFDRYARFNSWGSATEFFTWEDFQEIEFELPPIEEQRRVVRQYKTIADRIGALEDESESIERTAQILFNELFIDGSEEIELNEIAEINPERKLKKNQMALCYDMSTLPLKGSTPINGEYKPYTGGMRFSNGDTLMARITPCLENGKAAYINMLKDEEVAFGSTEYIVLSPKSVPSSFFYFLVRNNDFIQYAISQMTGTSGRQRASGDDIGKFKLKKPNESDLMQFDKLGTVVLTQMRLLSDEIQSLMRLQELIISKNM